MFIVSKRKKQKGFSAQKFAHKIITSTDTSRYDSVVKNLYYNVTIKRCSQPTALTTTTTTTTVKNANCLAKTTTIYMGNNCEGSREKNERDDTNKIKTNIATMKNKYSNSVSMFDVIWLILSLFVSVIVPNTNALMNAKLTATASGIAAEIAFSAQTTTKILELEQNNNSDDECVNKNISKCLERIKPTTTTTNITTNTTTLLKTNDNNNNSFNTEFAISTLLPSKVNIILQTDKLNKNISNNDNANDNNDNLLIEVDDEAATEYIFDRTDVRIIFITLYTLVFCCCFFGKYSTKNVNCRK